MRKTLFLALSLVLSATLIAQDEHKILTNADVLSMTMGGMNEKTIVLLIQQSQAKFDTSPDALVGLKKDGVSDEVLNAMLLAAAPRSKNSTDEAALDGSRLLSKALGAIGMPEQLASVHATRVKIAVTQITASGTADSQVERVTVYPDKLYATSQTSNGLLRKVVVTPEFSYQTSGNMEAALTSPVLDELRSGIKNESAYIAQHLTDYTCLSEGTEQIGSVATSRIRIKGQSLAHAFRNGTFTRLHFEDTPVIFASLVYVIGAALHDTVSRDTARWLQKVPDSSGNSGIDFRCYRGWLFLAADLHM
jgi:hypothetical protein